MDFKRLLYASTILLSTAFITNSYASYADLMCEKESNCRLDATNDYSTASGAYQMTQGALLEAGLIESKSGTREKHYGDGDWDNVQWSDNEFGVQSRQDFLNNPDAQQYAFERYSQSNWQALENNGTSEYVGAMYNDKPLTASSLLGMAHFLGPTGLKDYLENGYINDQVLANHHNAEEIIAERADRFADQDVSHITNGEVGMGSYAGNLIEMGGFQTADEMLAGCNPEVADTLNERSAQSVDTLVMMASSEEVGYTPMEESFGDLSCLENLLSGGVDATFSIPTLGDILGQLEDYVCGQAEELYAEATAPINESLSNMTGEMNGMMGGGFAPIQGMGNIVNGGNVDFSFNRNSSGGAMDRMNVQTNIPNHPDRQTVDGVKQLLNRVGSQGIVQ